MPRTLRTTRQRFNVCSWQKVGPPLVETAGACAAPCGTAAGFYAILRRIDYENCQWSAAVCGRADACAFTCEEAVDPDGPPVCGPATSPDDWDVTVSVADCGGFSVSGELDKQGGIWFKYAITLPLGLFGVIFVQADLHGTYSLLLAVYDPTATPPQEGSSLPCIQVIARSDGGGPGAACATVTFDCGPPIVWTVVAPIPVCPDSAHRTGGRCADLGVCLGPVTITLTGS